MNLFGMMETSGSAMQAERMRAEVVAANMANAETTRTEAGGPYRRQMVVFAAGQGDANFLDSMNAMSGNDVAGNNASVNTASGQMVQPSLLSGLRMPSLPGSGSIAPGVEIAQVIPDPSPALKRYDP